MPIEQDTTTPFGQWLLGPDWQDGALFSPLFFVVVVVLGALLLVWLASLLRKGDLRSAHRIGRTLTFSLLAAALVSGIVFGSYQATVWLIGKGFDGLIPIVRTCGDAIVDLVKGIGSILGENWLQGALYHWLLGMAVLLLASTVLAFLVTLLRSGWQRAVRAVDDGIASLLLDFAQTSTRLLALTWLTIKESIRRKIVIVFAVFLVGVAFAGWFLDPGSDNPARLYLGFVLSATTYLVLLLVLFLAALSLPADIRNRTIHTVVTKPVRPSEIVAGRVLGFSVVGTALLLGMGGISYVFVLRGLDHTHELTDGAKEQLAKYWKEVATDPKTLGVTVLTTTVQSHHHTLHVDVDASTAAGDEKGVRQGVVRTDPENGHSHEITYTVPAQGDVAYACSGPLGQLQARVPIYGKLHYRNREGKDTNKGINVGDEWEYRGYVEGGTLSAAVWRFTGLREEDFPRGLPVEMTLGVFRSYKGEITKGVPGSLALRNPKTGEEVVVTYFASKEFQTHALTVPRTVIAPDGRKFDLFKDLTDDGKVEIVLNCVAPHQFFGAGQADLYIRADSASFFINFFKGYLGIWMQMVLIIGFGVMYSTFLSGPIAWLATLATLVGGLYSDFLGRLAAHSVYGGGPFEATIRLVTQQNVTSDLAVNPQTTVAKMIDGVAEFWMRVVWYILPDFSRFGFNDHVAYGFNVSGDLMLRGLLQTAAFLVPLVALGYVFLRSRELAQ